MSGKYYEIVLNGWSFQRSYDSCELSDMKADLSFFLYSVLLLQKDVFSRV